MTKNLLCANNILRKQFPNGVTVLIHENPWSDTAAISGSVCAGHFLESSKQTGLSAFTAAALTMGTRSMTGEQISDFLENIGGTLSFYSGPHKIKFDGKCLSEDLPGLLKLVKEILSEPTFPEDKLAFLRNNELDGNIWFPTETYDVAYEAFKNILWGSDHPYGRKNSDSVKRLEKLTREDLLRFHSHFFGPKNFILTISGDCCGQEIMDRCEEIFGSWSKEQAEIEEDKFFTDVCKEWEDDKPRICVRIDSWKELALCIGTFGPAVGSPDLIPARLGNIILGGGNMTSRILQTVREEHGLVYEIYSSLEPRKKGGCWAVTSSVEPDDIKQVGDLIIAEINRFLSEPVSMKELEDAKSWYIGCMPLALTTNVNMASALYDLAFYDMDLDHFLRLPGQVRTVTPEIVLETARKWIEPENLLRVTAGPLDDKGFLW